VIPPAAHLLTRTDSAVALVSCCGTIGSCSCHADVLGVADCGASAAAALRQYVFISAERSRARNAGGHYGAMGIFISACCRSCGISSAFRRIVRILPEIFHLHVARSAIWSDAVLLGVKMAGQRIERAIVEGSIMHHLARRRDGVLADCIILRPPAHEEK